MQKSKLESEFWGYLLLFSLLGVPMYTCALLLVVGDFLLLELWQPLLLGSMASAIGLVFGGRL